MKRISLLAILITVCNIAGITKYLTPSEALVRFNSSNARNVKRIENHPLKLNIEISSSSGVPVVFLYTSDLGSVILSGSDNVPALIGYTENPIDADAIPDGMKYWMEYMADEIAYAEGKNTGGVAVESVGPAIQPLLHTLWGQTGAYNTFTPIVNEKQSPSGCVATALAQIMYYHKWPVHPTGIVNCTDTNKDAYTMDLDTVTFEWNKMLQAYTEESDEESINAVGLMMKGVGYAVNMQYGASSSGATNANAKKGVIENLGYSKDLTVVHREAFTRQEWDGMLYEMLSNGQPVFYTGRDAVWLGSGGHAFVCDGYDGEGYFHFNWGWDGKYNGYFLTSCMVPAGAGTGGFINGYNYSQEVFVNFYPDNGDEFISYEYVQGLNFDEKDFVLTAEFTSLPSKNKKYYVGVAISPKDSLLKADDVIREFEIVGDGSVSIKIDESITNMLNPELEYAVRYVWREESNEEWRRVVPPTDGLLLYYSQPFGGILAYEDDQWKFNAEALDRDPYDITVDELTFNGEDYLFLNENSQMKMRITNNDDDYFNHGMRIYFVDIETGEKPKFLNFSLEINPKDSVELSFTIKDFKGLPAGKYYVEFTEANTHAHISMDTSRIYYVLDEETLPQARDATFIYTIMPQGYAVLNNTISGEAAGGDTTIPAYIEYEGTRYDVKGIKKALNEIIDAYGIQTLHIEAPLTAIPDNALKNCKELETLTLPTTLRSIGNYAFYACNKLKELELPEGVETIGIFAFSGCYALESLKLPGSLHNISDNSFSSCRVLERLVIPEGVTSLGTRSFCYSYELRELILPATLQSIGNRAFYSFYSTLEKIKCPATDLPDLDEGAFPTSYYNKAQLYVPSTSLEEYKAHPVWGKFVNILPDETMTTGVETFTKYDDEGCHVCSCSGGAEVVNACGKEVKVYSVNGALIARAMAKSDSLHFELLPGIYIVGVDQERIKIVVK